MTPRRVRGRRAWIGRHELRSRRRGRDFQTVQARHRHADPSRERAPAGPARDDAAASGAGAVSPIGGRRARPASRPPRRAGDHVRSFPAAVRAARLARTRRTSAVARRRSDRRTTGRRRAGHRRTPPRLADPHDRASARRGRVRACSPTRTARIDCPQMLDTAVLPDAVQWTLLSDPPADAIATVEVPLSDAGPHGGGTEVNVYGRFQIVGSYTVAGSATPSLTYIGGVAQATMTWDGKQFPNVTFAAGAIDPPPGVNVPTFDHPASVKTRPCSTRRRLGSRSGVRMPHSCPARRCRSTPITVTSS